MSRFVRIMPLSVPSLSLGNEEAPQQRFRGFTCSASPPPPTYPPDLGVILRDHERACVRRVVLIGKRFVADR